MDRGLLLSGRIGFCLRRRYRHRSASTGCTLGTGSKPANAGAGSVFINDRWQQLDLSQQADLTQRSRAGGSPDSAHYQGRVRGAADSWVRLSWIDDAWQGGIFIGGELMLLERRQRVSQLLSQPDRSNSRQLLFNVRDVRFYHPH